MSISYDASVIRTFAAALYLRAAEIVRAATLAGGVIGFIVGLGLGAVTQNATAAIIAGIVCAAIGAALGRYLAQAAAFKLKLQAQVALCQVQIEENTRMAAVVARQMPAAPIRPANTNAA